MRIKRLLKRFGKRERKSRNKSLASLGYMKADRSSGKTRGGIMFIRNSFNTGFMLKAYYEL
jgi:hypothetical protein